MDGNALSKTNMVASIIWEMRGLPASSAGHIFREFPTERIDFLKAMCYNFLVTGR